MNKNQKFMIMMFCLFVAGIILFGMAYLGAPLNSQERLNMMANAGIMVATLSGAFLIYLFQKKD